MIHASAPTSIQPGWPHQAPSGGAAAGFGPAAVPLVGADAVKTAGCLGESPVVREARGRTRCSRTRTRDTRPPTPTRTLERCTPRSAAHEPVSFKNEGRPADRTSDAARLLGWRNDRGGGWGVWTRVCVGHAGVCAGAQCRVRQHHRLGQVGDRPWVSARAGSCRGAAGAAAASGRHCAGRMAVFREVWARPSRRPNCGDGVGAKPPRSSGRDFVG
jgi:hypothetical protein